jgi:hypothetical protein
MRRPALYSQLSARPPLAGCRVLSVGLDTGPCNPPLVGTGPRRSASSPRVLWAAIAMLALLLVLTLALSLRPGQRRITQEDINAAVLKTLDHHHTCPLPPPRPTRTSARRWCGWSATSRKAD